MKVGRKRTPCQGRNRQNNEGEMTRHTLATVLVLACVASHARGDALLDRKGEFGPEPRSETQQIAFEVPEDTRQLSLDTTVRLKQGKASVQVVSPKGTKLFDVGTGGWMTLSRSQVRTAGEAGTFHVVLVPDKAVGTWTVTVDAAGPPDLRSVHLMLGSAIGMILVGGAAVGAWRFLSGVPWRWFWIGAAVWTVGVALKFAWAIALNKPILGALRTGLSHGLYLRLGSVYIGILTGVFEIGVTLIAALIWRGIARSSARGVAVGVGAGAFEAALFGIAASVTRWPASSRQVQLRIRFSPPPRAQPARRRCSGWLVLSSVCSPLPATSGRAPSFLWGLLAGTGHGLSRSRFC